MLNLSFNCLEKEAEAIAGSVCFIKYSPISRASKPPLRSLQAISTLCMPLSATRMVSPGSILFSRILRSMLTSKFFRLRLLMPTKSASWHTCSHSGSSCISSNTSRPILCASAANSLTCPGLRMAAISKIISAPLALASYN